MLGGALPRMENDAGFADPQPEPMLRFDGRVDLHAHTKLHSDK